MPITGPLPKIACVPDTAFTLRAGSVANAYYVELERGTTPPSRAAAKKSPGYTGLADGMLHLRHLPDAPREFSVLVLAPHPGGGTSSARSSRGGPARICTSSRRCGDKGTLKAGVQKYGFFPMGAKQPALSGTPLYDKFPKDKTEKDLEQHVASALRRHWQDFLRARESRGKPVADIEQGHISTASCILANLSAALGRSVAFDPATHTVTGDPEATKRLKREYRKPWVHPAG